MSWPVGVLRIRGDLDDTPDGVIMRHIWPSVFKRFAFSAVLVAFFGLGSSDAFAHPLGNFTSNNLARIQVGTDAVKLHAVIDLAEIPTFQELQKIDIDADGQA